MKTLTVLALVTSLAACSTVQQPERIETRRQPMPDIARSGGVSRSVGAAVPLAIGCRALSVARALTRSAGMGQLSSACSAATRL